jgi:type I restriction enzyme S subunit
MEMTGDWPEVALSELTEPDTPITYGVVKPGVPDPRGVLFIRGGDIAHGRVLIGQLRTITDSVARQYQRTLLRGGEIVVSLVGNPGQVAVVPESLRGANIARQVGLVRLRATVDTHFVKYFLSSSKGKAALGAQSIGSVQQVINLRDLKTVRVPIPPLAEQRTIAGILGRLDDKIELNRKMNETLEAMARALFKSWFVDFDPVHAKTEGRDPGLPADIAALFPDSFEDSDLGLIPKGWNVGKLGDVLRQRIERCVASAETASQPYVPIDCISPDSLSLTESKPGQEAQSSLTKFHKGDLLLGAMRPYFHKVCIAPFDGTTRTTAFVLYSRQTSDFAFATLLLHDQSTIDYATRHSTGSTIPYAVWASSLENMPVVLPPERVRAAYNNTVRPILVRIPMTHFESHGLVALRDTLLPKLMSGELRLPLPELDKEHSRDVTKGKGGMP